MIDLPGMVVPLFTRGYSERHAYIRRGYGLHFYEGSNGGGKSFAALHDTLLSLESGRRVLSTVRILDYRNPRPCPGGPYCDDPAGHERERMAYDLRLVNALDPLDPDPQRDDPNTVELVVELPTGIVDVHQAAHPLFVALRSYDQLTEWRGGDCILDEVQGVASSRQSMSLPAPLANKLHQLRRDDVLLRITGVRFARADKVLREAVSAVTECQGAYAVQRVADDGSKRVWRDRRLFEWTTYDDVAGYDEWSQGKADAADPVCYQRLWRQKAPTVAGAYDTLDQVLALGAAAGDNATSCGTCGGKRRQPVCKCADHGGMSDDQELDELDTPGVPAPSSRGARRTRATVRQSA